MFEKTVYALETSTGLRPKELKHGIYRFHREAFDTEIEIEEPGGDTYLLNIQELEPFLRITLKQKEETQLRLTDMLWNFLNVVYDTETGRIQCLR